MGWLENETRAAEINEYHGAHNTRPYVGEIVSVDVEGEQIVVDSITGKKPFNYPHAFQSATSWIRSVPDPGSGVIMQRSIGDPLILRLYNPVNIAAAYQTAVRAVREDPTNKDFKGSLNNYRTLRPGEHHLASVGLAELYMSARGAFEMRGGAVTRAAVHDDLESVDRAPLHKRLLHLNQIGVMGDEERFGVVKRYDPDKQFIREVYVRLPNPQGFTPPPSGGVAGAAAAVLGALVPKAAAKEHTVILDWNGLPDRLYERRVGHVFEDDPGDPPEQAKMSATSVPLRFLERFYTTPLGNPFEIQIDELGNFSVSLPDEALFGGEVKVPKGGFKMEVALDLALTVLKAMAFTVTGKWTADVTGGIELKTQAIAELIGTVKTALGGAASSLQPVTHGVLTGSSLDPLSGKPFHAFAQGSTKVVAAL